MSEWIHIKLGEVGSFNNGINKGNKSFGYGVPFVNLLDVFNKSSISHIPNDLVDASETEISAYSLKKGDILFVRSSVKPEGVGKTCVVLCELPRTVYSGFIIRFRQNEAIFDVGYSKYCFDCTTFRKQILSYSTVSANTNINQVSLKKLGIKIPKFLNEQRKIARILSTVDEVIEMTEAAIDKYKAIKAGMMRDLFTRGIDVATGKLRPSYEEAPELYKQSELGWLPKEWDVVPTIFFSEIISGATPSTRNSIYWNGDINWITPADMSKLKTPYFYKTERRITKEGVLNCATSILPEKSIVMSSRAPIGYFAIGVSEFATNQGCKSFKLKANHNPEYHYYNMLFNIKKFLNLGSGSTFVEISKKAVEKVRLAISMNAIEQKAIANKLISCDKNINQEEIVLYKYQQIKKALMVDLLTGKVRVKYEEEKAEVA